VNVIAITAGLKTNITGNVTSAEGGRGNTASANLSAQSPTGQPDCQDQLESALERQFGGVASSGDGPGVRDRPRAAAGHSTQTTGFSQNNAKED